MIQKQRPKAVLKEDATTVAKTTTCYVDGCLEYHGKCVGKKGNNKCASCRLFKNHIGMTRD